MLLYLLVLHAYKFIAITDDTKMPMYAYKPFASPNDQLLYINLTMFMQFYENKKEFLNLVNVVKDYCKICEKCCKRKPTTAEIKLQFASSITKEFGIGKFHLGMLELAKEFDKDLIYHCSNLCKYDSQTIYDAVQIKKQDYTYPIYIINRSFCYLSQTYITLAYETVKLQLKHKRWVWQRNGRFDRLIGMVGSVKDFEYVFCTSESEYKNCNFPFEHMFFENLDEDEIIEYLKNCEKDRTTVYLGYCLSDIIYSDIFWYDKNTLLDPQTACENMCDQLLYNSNQFFLLNLVNYYCPGLVPIMILRTILDFEYFFVHFSEVTSDCALEEWKRHVEMSENLQQKTIECIWKLLNDYWGY